MPKRTNDFQKLVFLVRSNLAGSGTVTESKMLMDRISGKEVEVDVCIEGILAGQAVTISIECQDRSRMAGPSWISEMKAKHERLPTNVLILAARRGFTKPARNIARAYGIQTCSLTDVNTLDFPKLLHSKSTLWSKALTLLAQKVSVKVAATDYVPVEFISAWPDNSVMSADGSIAGSMLWLVQHMLSYEQTLKYYRKDPVKHVVPKSAERADAPSQLRRVAADGGRDGNEVRRFDGG